MKITNNKECIYGSRTKRNGVHVWRRGEVFSREEAKRHEVQLQVMELIKDSVYGYENSLEKVIEVIVDNFDEIEMIVRDKY